MKSAMKILCAAAIVGLFVTMPATAQDKPPAARIQMAILLDTSGSMRGLIEQAKAELWRIVNEFATTRKNGRPPVLEVALYEYGKSSIPSSEGYLRMICPLTTDLDKISEELFILKTNGGEEYCGQVIEAATNGLAWSTSGEDLKVIFIAGNERFTQGRVDYRASCKAAIAKGIIVNTIHCGSEREGINGKWNDGASLADGRFMNIDHNRKVAHIAAPQDKKLAELGAELNKTYIGYGLKGREGSVRQRGQDSAALSLSPGVFSDRAVAKSSKQYRNESWDLVDALKGGKVKLEDVKDEELPAPMKKMSKAEREAYVKAHAKKRLEIQAKIKALGGERKKYIADKRKAGAGKDTLGKAITEAVREQAARKNFKVATKSEEKSKAEGGAEKGAEEKTESK